MHAFRATPSYSSTTTSSTTMAAVHSRPGAIDSPRAPLSDEEEYGAKLHRTTLARRAKGQIQSRDDYREECSLLSRAKQEHLLQYIDKLTRRGLPPDHHNVRVFAYNICGNWPGKNWTSRFVRQYQDRITSQYLVGLNISRKRADNWWLVNSFFNTLQEK